VCVFVFVCVCVCAPAAVFGSAGVVGVSACVVDVRQCRRVCAGRKEAEPSGADASASHDASASSAVVAAPRRDDDDDDEQLDLKISPSAVDRRRRQRVDNFWATLANRIGWSGESSEAPVVALVESKLRLTAVVILAWQTVVVLLAIWRRWPPGCPSPERQPSDGCP
jgi:hypothetical protein